VLLLGAVLALAACERYGPQPSPFGATPGSSEFEVRGEVYSHAADLYRSEDFVALDAMLAEQFGKKLRTPSGIWQAGVALAGILGEEDDGKKSEDRARRWLRSRPDSPFAPLVLAGTMYRNGCSCTGNDADAKRQRRENYIEAMRVLEEHRPQSSGIPEFHELQVELATGLGLSEAKVRQYYDEGVRQEPNYFPLRFAWVSYLARQDNPAVRVEAAARETTREPASPERDALYGRMLWWAVQDSDWERLLAWNGIDWPTFDRSFASMLASYPDDWNRNNYARFACLAGHRERTRALMADRKPLAGVWRSELEFNQCMR